VDAPGGDPLGIRFTSPITGTLVALAGHMHPNGMEVAIANLGPAGSGCEADGDGDGFPGVTLLHSRKLDQNPLAWPFSEDYQMAASKFGFRADVRAGDRITQFGVYANERYASYEAMSYTGIYVDRAQLPGPRTGDCMADLAPRLVGSDTGPANEGILNHPWGHVEPLCGLQGYPACDRPVSQRPEGQEVPVVQIGGFAYIPGDLGLTGPLGAPPRVREGASLRFVNADVGALIRHTVTSCDAPCNGLYTANYPGPDGLFDSGKLGNLDYIDGGITGDDTVPYWESPTDLQPGMYTYYCRIHPWMRGAFEVIAA
jgi:plastocyanin